MAVFTEFWAECDLCHDTYPHIWEEGSPNLETALRRAEADEHWHVHVASRDIATGLYGRAYCPDCPPAGCCAVLDPAPEP